jgi:hypothetical protein
LRGVKTRAYRLETCGLGKRLRKRFEFICISFATMGTQVKACPWWLKELEMFKRRGDVEVHAAACGRKPKLPVGFGSRPLRSDTLRARV